jgi:isocitrate/isopropylmalate dehydrogenase
MMFEISLGRPDIAAAISRAIERTLEDGIRTRDLRGSAGHCSGTRDFTAAVRERLAAEFAARGVEAQ